MIGVVYDGPVFAEGGVPPDDVGHQLTVPADALAPNVTVPVPHIEPGAVDVIVGGA